jgi:hypothetical protein
VNPRATLHGVSSPALSLRPASDAERDARNLLTAPVWGNRLTVEQYLGRERCLRATAFARGMRTWVLVDDEDAVLASCESYKMTSLGRAAGVVQGIASVFVEEKHRGHAHAQAMLTRLLDRFRFESADASMLFSEVGAPIYGKIGYVPRPIHARVWDPVESDPGDVAALLVRGGPGPDISTSVSPGAPTPRFRIVLSPAQIEWHRERAAYYHGVLAPDRRPPDSLTGAMSGNAWILWVPDYRLERLMVLVVRTGSAEDNAAIVEALRRAAHAFGMPVAELWESPAVKLPGGREIPRDDEIPMICPIAKGVAPEDWVDYGRGCWV